MKTTLRGGCKAVGLFVAIVLGTQVVSAQSFSFPVSGFTTTNVCKNSGTAPPACQVLTDGSPSLPTVATGGILRLTTANQNQHGAAWFRLPQPISTGFTTAFQFQISNTNSCFGCAFPADGMALVIQNDAAGTGAIGYTGNGQNMAYGNNDVSTASGPGNAIKNSLAIELDTHQNSNYSDPDGNHIAVQSCGPNNATTLTPNSADHNYACPDGNLAKLALQSLPSGTSLTDGKTHTITVNYLPPGTCTSNCNNLSVYLDSTLILQATVDIAKQLNLTANGGAYIGFTGATGSSVENNDIISWSFSSLPLAPITINQPLQPTQTNFNYTPTLTAISDYSQSGLGNNSFNGVFMQGTVQTITDQQFSDLVNNTPFQGSTCQHQDAGSGNYGCVITTDLCTTSTNSQGSGANCPNTGTNALIIVSNSYNLDPSQKPIIAPGYVMGKDNALTCGPSGDNTCKGLVNIFSGISGDLATTGGHTNNFNSTLIPILGAVQPSTAATTSPVLNSGWINRSVTMNFNSAEIVPSNNTNPPATLPTVSNIAYSATGANLPSPASGTLSGASGSIAIPVAAEGTTVVTFFATDSSGTIENVITNDSSTNTVSSASPTITIKVDLTPPTFSCTPPVAAWQATDVSVPCTASDNANGSGLATPASFNVSTTVPSGTETNTAQSTLTTVADVAGNTVPVPAYGPFWVDKKAPVINGPTMSPSSPAYGQSVTGNYSCTDGGSGVVLCGPSGSGTIAATGNTGPLSNPADSTVGTHTFTVNAQDALGNLSTPSSVTYTVAQATQTVSFTGAPATAAFGSTFTVSATTNATTTAVITAAGACSIAGNVVTMTSGTGTCSLMANWAADTNYLAASASQSTNATHIAPTVSFTGAPNTAAYLATFTVATTTNASTTATITAAGACSITANTVKMNSGVGICSLTAAWASDNNYLAATASQSTNAAQITPTVTFTGAPASAAYLSTFGVAATTNASTTATITAVGPCSITGATVTMTSGTGTCLLTATWAADNNYSATTASQSPSATKTAPTVTFKGAPAAAVIGSTFVVSAATTASTTAALTAAGPCSITGTTVTMTGGTGTCLLAASWAADNNYSAASANQVTTATKGTSTTTITSVSPNPAAPGNPVAVSYSVVGSTNVTVLTGSVTVSANTGETCTATAAVGGCSLTFATGGPRTVSASYSGDTNFSSSSTTTSVLVTVGDFSITATPASQTISSGHQATYSVIVAPINGLTGTVNLSCSGGPPNSTCSVSPSVDNLQGNPVSSTVTLSSNKNVNHGTFTLTFTGNYGNGALVHSASVSLTVK